MHVSLRHRGSELSFPNMSLVELDDDSDDGLVGIDTGSQEKDGQGQGDEELLRRIQELLPVTIACSLLWQDSMHL